MATVVQGFVGCCLATKLLVEWVEMVMGVAWVARGNIQQISYIPQTDQHEPEG